MSDAYDADQAVERAYGHIPYFREVERRRAEHAKAMSSMSYDDDPPYYGANPLVIDGARWVNGLTLLKGHEIRAYTGIPEGWQLIQEGRGASPDTNIAPDTTCYMPNAVFYTVPPAIGG